MSDIANKLEAALRYDVLNGDIAERAVLGRQIGEAIRRIKFLDEAVAAHQGHIEELEAEVERLLDACEEAWVWFETGYPELKNNPDNIVCDKLKKVLEIEP